MIGPHSVRQRCLAVRIRNRKDIKPFRFWRFSWSWLVLIVLLLSPAIVRAQEQAAPTDEGSFSLAPHTLHLAEIQLSGATRTSLETVYRFLPLRPGQPIDQATLIEAITVLRERGLFNSVSFYTRPGLQRGQLILVLEVEELGFDFRWAAGNTDMDGWYLVPAMLSYDNALGKGRVLDFQARFGFRHGGWYLRYGQPRAGDGSRFWGARLSAVSTDMPYFSEGVEYRHEVKFAGIQGIFGKQFSDNARAEIGLKYEGLTVADHSEAHTESLNEGIGYGQNIPQEDLPASIAEAVGQDSRAVVHLDMQYDTRSRELRAGSPTSGIWGRLLGKYYFQDQRFHPGIQADFRAYQNIPGGVLAARLRGAWVGENSAFYDRLYLGGMYTVRGFQTNSLSAPGGDTWLFSGSLEFRSRILGDRKGTKLAGVFFLDAGASGSSDLVDPYNGFAIGAGYGLRMRVWWLDWIGLDVGFPLTERPMDTRFQVTASIGWSF